MTRQVISRLVPGPGNFLYSNRRNPMLTLINDESPGPHDISFAACDPGFYADLGSDEYHPNCSDNFHKALNEVNVQVETPPDPFNLFRYTVPKSDGSYEVGQTLTSPGDYVEFSVEMGVLVVVTACSVYLPIDGFEPNGGKSTPVRIEVD